MLRSRPEKNGPDRFAGRRSYEWRRPWAEEVYLPHHCIGTVGTLLRMWCLAAVLGAVLTGGSLAVNAEESAAEQAVWKQVKQLDEQLAGVQQEQQQVQTRLNQLRHAATDQELKHHELTRSVEQTREQLKQAEASIKAAEEKIAAARKQREQAMETLKTLATMAEATASEKSNGEKSAGEKSNGDKVAGEEKAKSDPAKAAEKKTDDKKTDDKKTEGKKSDDQPADGQAEQKPLTRAEQQKQAREAQQAAEIEIAEQQKKLAAAREQLQKLPAQLTEQREWAVASQQQLDARAKEIEATQLQLTAFRKQHLALRQQTEQILRQAGLWVSFANEVAPIFHQQCVACHNVRNAKGHYSMETYQAILAGGESGPAIVPGESADSLLCLMVSTGEMPLESDPLTAEQIQVIERWVQLGSRLDSHAAADTRLIRLIPRRPQPSAPEQYRVPVPVTALAISPDQRWLASSGYHEVLVWSLPEGKLLRRIGNVAESVYGLAFNGVGTELAVAAGTPGRVGEVKVFHPETGELRHDLLLAEDAAFAVAYSPDQKWLAAAGADRTIHLFEAESGKLQRTVDVHADWINSVTWSPDSQKLVSASRDKSVKVIEAATGRVLRTFTAHGAAVTAASFLPDGKRIVSTGNDRRVRVWDASSGKELRSSGNSGEEQTRLMVQNAKQGVLAGAGPQIRLLSWDETKVEKQWPTQGALVTSLALTPDGTTLITGSLDGLIQLRPLKAAEPSQHWIASPGFTD